MSKRRLIVDVETTGLSRSEGHRIIEFCALEVINDELTGDKLHLFFNPECDVSVEVTKIHGITLAELQDKPKFSEYANHIWRYISGAELIMHNAPFDIKFIQHEFKLAFPSQGFIMPRHIDTLALSRQLIKEKGSRHNLDALCDRFRIDRTKRVNHGALLDCELLFEVWQRLRNYR